MRQEMSYNTIAKIVGVLFIIGTASGILSLGFIGSTQGSLDLAKVAADENQVLIGALLIFIMAAACAGTTICLYPVLKKYNEALALGAMGFRLIEGTLMVAAAVCILTLLSLSKDSVAAGAPVSSYYSTLAISIQAGYNWIFNVPMLLAWCTAALMYYYVLYQTKLIPRWLSAWGLIGIVMAMAAAFTTMFGLFDPSMPINTLLNLPIMVQEMIFAAWLVIFGFNAAAFDSLSAGAKGRFEPVAAAQ